MPKSFKELVDEKIEDIKSHPENHKHSFEALRVCCMVGNVLDTSVLDAHSEYVDLGTNGGTRCDTMSGPCACGAWH